ncbi:Holliday junction branch migration DNA helicase RuvB, partial [Clavibacter phaseoli]
EALATPAAWAHFGLEAPAVPGAPARSPGAPGAAGALFGDEL